MMSAAGAGPPLSFFPFSPPFPFFTIRMQQGADPPFSPSPFSALHPVAISRLHAAAKSFGALGLRSFPLFFLFFFFFFSLPLGAIRKIAEKPRRLLRSFPFLPSPP